MLLETYKASLFPLLFLQIMNVLFIQQHRVYAPNKNLISFSFVLLFFFAFDLFSSCTLEECELTVEKKAHCINSDPFAFVSF